MPKKQKPQVRPGAPEPEELPDWLNTTPEHEETGYCLQIDGPNDGSVLQEVKVTRDEYEYLKRCLAVRRDLIDSHVDYTEGTEVEAARAERAAQNGGSAPPVSKPQLPKWLQEPPDYEYCMMMTEGGAGVQDADLTREEYLALRAIVACKRICDHEEYPGAAGVSKELRYEMIAFSDVLKNVFDRAPVLAEAFGYLLAEEEETTDAA